MKKEPFVTIPKSEYDSLMKIKDDFHKGNLIYFSHFSCDQFSTYERITTLSEAEALLKMSAIIRELQQELDSSKNKSFFKKLFQ